MGAGRLVLTPWGTFTSYSLPAFLAHSANGMVRPCSRPASNEYWQGGTEDKEHAMSQKLDTSPAVIGIDIGKNSFHIVGQNQRGAIVLRQKWSRGPVEACPLMRSHAR